MQSVVAFASQILERNLPISLLMNNAGTMETGFHTTSEGFERTVSVNYMGPYLLTRKLIPLMVRGARIVKYGFLYIRNRQARLPRFLS